MPLCSNTLRALSRSRVHPRKTILPFLYHTATIQQWQSASQQYVTHRAASSRHDLDDIPFESDEGLPPPVDDIQSSGRKTTITGPERQAFQKLYRKFNSQERPNDENRYPHERDQIADEYYEDDDDGTGASLDTMFDAVLQGNPNLGNNAKRGRGNNAHRMKKAKKADDLATLAAQILKPELDKSKKKSNEEAAKEKTRIKELQTQERERVDALIADTKTDRELWEVLEREVFSLIRRLDLDNETKSAQQHTGARGKKHTDQQSLSSPTASSATKPTTQEYDFNAPRFPTTPSNILYTPPTGPSRSDPSILFPNYPHHLVTAVTTLRTKFPTSPLPLSILPTIKSLGRDSYALGATTALYHQLILTAWTQQSSYGLITTLLSDMDNGGIEIDHSILTTLDAILSEYTAARGGRLGRGMMLVSGLQMWEEELKKVKAWRNVVRERLNVWASERSRRGEILRKVDERGGRGSDVVRGPKDEIRQRRGKKGKGEQAPPVQLGPREKDVRQFEDVNKVSGAEEVKAERTVEQEGATEHLSIREAADQGGPEDAKQEEGASQASAGQSSEVSPSSLEASEDSPSAGKKSDGSSSHV